MKAIEKLNADHLTHEVSNTTIHLFNASALIGAYYITGLLFTIILIINLSKI
jgi:hypothetical protein